MKSKILIGMVVLAMLITSVMAFSISQPIQEEEEGCGEDCQAEQQQEKLKEIQHEKDLQQQRINQHGGGSFYLNKDKTIFNLTSKYDGYGFGVTFGKYLLNPLKLNLPRTNLRSVTINFEKNSLGNLNTFHYKQIPTKKYNNRETIESYEFLNNIDVKYYEIEFRVEKGVNPMVITESETGTQEYRPTKLNKDGYTQDYYSAYIGEAEIITITEQNEVE